MPTLNLDPAALAKLEAWRDFIYLIYGDPSAPKPQGEIRNPEVRQGEDDPSRSVPQWSATDDQEIRFSRKELDATILEQAREYVEACRPGDYVYITGITIDFKVKIGG